MIKSLLSASSPTRWTAIECATKGCPRRYVSDFQIDVMIARTCRVSPLERAMAWDGWVRVWSKHYCPACFERMRREPANDGAALTEATIERRVLQRIEVMG